MYLGPETISLDDGASNWWCFGLLTNSSPW
jgi:hypothetical protein